VEIDFSWFLFIGRTKLNLTFKETMRLTLTMFNKLYKHYKDDWSMEMRMTHANMTYADVFKKAQQDEEWF
jgi:hypothetical protein